MQNVPKIVRERLGAARSPANHPDADLLTAFAEQSLSRAERALVIEHLSRCGDCRNVVALALPAIEAQQTAVRPAATSWPTWPVLRWGIVAAGVIAVASLGIVRYQRHSAEMALKSQPRVEIAQTVTKAKDQVPAPAASAPTKSEEGGSQRAANSVEGVAGYSVNEKKTLRLAAPSEPAAAPFRGGTLRNAPTHGGPLMANQSQQNSVQNQAGAAGGVDSLFAKQQAAGDMAAKMTVPPVSENVAVDARSATLDTRQTETAQALPPPSPSAESFAGRVDKAKPAMGGQSAGVLTGAPSAPAAARPTLVSSIRSARWTISSEGQLLRSFDEGVNWQPVDVNADQGTSTLEISAKTSRAKAQKTASPIFRAVAANGSDVWAGGSASTLYHSLDSGSHWIRVWPASGGATLSGDIVSLEFSDTQHGRVSTSTPEIWATTDGGRTWHKQ